MKNIMPSQAGYGIAVLRRFDDAVAGNHGAFNLCQANHLGEPGQRQRARRFWRQLSVIGGMRRKSSCSSKTFFTLTEVIVAVVVVSITAPILLRAISLNAQLDQQAFQCRQAANLADLQLQKLLLSGDWIAGADAGDFGADYPGYSWVLTTEQWLQDNVSLQQLNIRVAGPAGNRTAVTLSALSAANQRD